MPTIYIKDSNDKSSWPNGATPLFVINGLGVTALDTEFDAVMRDMAGPDVIVRLGPGVFLTRGACGNSFAQADKPGWRMQSGGMLIGSGRTTLKLVACNSQHGGLVVGANEFERDGTTPTANSGMAVKDLDIDCNAAEIAREDLNAPWHIQGIHLWGTTSRIERVNVSDATAMGINTTPPAVESFILAINSLGDSVGNLIDRCSVSDFHNPYGTACCSAISMNCWQRGFISGVISNCDVTLNGESGRGFGGEFAYNLSCAKQLSLTNCRSRGAQRGFNNDSLPNSSIEVSNNYFDMPPGNCVGFALLKSNELSKFTGNTVILRGEGSSGFLVDMGGDGNRILLKGNSVIEVGSWPGKAYAFNFHDNLDSEKIPLMVHMEDNKVVYQPWADLYTLIFPQCGYMAGNTVNGVEWLWPLQQPNDGWKFPVEKTA